MIKTKADHRIKLCRKVQEDSLQSELYPHIVTSAETHRATRSLFFEAIAELLSDGFFYTRHNAPCNMRNTLQKNCLEILVTAKIPALVFILNHFLLVCPVCEVPQLQFEAVGTTSRNSL